MDYMKGYNSRNSRRRSSYSRRRASYRRRRRRPGIDVFSVLKWAGPAVLLVAAIAVVFFFWQKKESGTGKLAATAASVEAVQTVAEPASSPMAGQGTVSSAVKEVGALSSDSIVKPTPAPTVRSKAVALTFDDGPSTVNTPKILATLKRYNAHATFFIVGNRAAAGADVLKPYMGSF